MANIIRRLREPPFGTETSERNLMAAAADEIERLRDENVRLREALEASKKRFEVLRSAYDQLRNKPIEIYGSAALAEQKSTQEK